MENPYKQFRWGDLWFFLSLILATILFAIVSAEANWDIDGNIVAFVVIGIELAYIFLVVKKRPVNNKKK